MWRPRQLVAGERQKNSGRSDPAARFVQKASGPSRVGAQIRAIDNPPRDSQAREVLHAWNHAEAAPDEILREIRWLWCLDRQCHLEHDLSLVHVQVVPDLSLVLQPPNEVVKILQCHERASEAVCLYRYGCLAAAAARASTYR